MYTEEILQETSFSFYVFKKNFFFLGKDVAYPFVEISSSSKAHICEDNFFPKKRREEKHGEKSAFPQPSNFSSRRRNFYVENERKGECGSEEPHFRVDKKRLCEKEIPHLRVKEEKEKLLLEFGDAKAREERIS